MSFPPYPKYKDSGVEWLGQVPEHWNVHRLGVLFRQVAESGEEGLPILSVSIHDGVSDKELNEDELDRKVSRSKDKEKYNKVRPGDLVYNMMRAWQGGFGCVSVEGMVSPAYVIARPNTSNMTGIIEQQLRTPNAIEEMRRHSQGVTDFRLRLYWDEFKTLQVTLPPISEQHAIATFLDRETAKIDALIAEQRRLIELLKEKRQAVISHAVTKGLNPNAPMKDSGIEWLGEVPEHWEVKPLKHIAEDNDGIQMGPFGGMLLDLSPTDTGYKVYGQENTISGDYHGGSRWIARDRYNDLTRYHISNGDVVLTRKGSIGNARLIHNLPQPGIIDSDTIRIRVKCREISSSYLELLLHEADYIKEQIALSKRGAILAGLNSQTIAMIVLMVPPLEEQNQLLNFLSSRIAELESAANESLRSITLLQERRSALISAAVTGKIDVRGVAGTGDAA